MTNNRNELKERIRRYKELAKEHYREGIELLKKHPHKACESVWRAVDRLTRAVCLKYLGRESPTNGETWREFIKSCLVKAGLPNKDANDLAKTFLAIRGELHGRCLYGGIYDEKEHKDIIENLTRKYIEKLMKLLS